MRLSTRDLQNLVDVGIVEIRGLSGIPATVDQAKRAPMCFGVNAMSGKTFHVMYNAELDQFKLTRTN